MSKFESFMVKLTASADDFTRAMTEAREAAEKLAIAFWRAKPWWGKVAYLVRHPVSAARLIRTTSKGK